MIIVLSNSRAGNIVMTPINIDNYHFLTMLDDAGLSDNIRPYDRDKYGDSVVFDKNHKFYSILLHHPNNCV